jgi:hypothetical protein
MKIAEDGHSSGKQRFVMIYIKNADDDDDMAKLHWLPELEASAHRLNPNYLGAYTRWMPKQENTKQNELSQMMQSLDEEIDEKDPNEDGEEFEEYSYGDDDSSFGKEEEEEDPVEESDRHAKKVDIQENDDDSSFGNNWPSIHTRPEIAPDDQKVQNEQKDLPERKIKPDDLIRRIALEVKLRNDGIEDYIEDNIRDSTTAGYKLNVKRLRKDIGWLAEILQETPCLNSWEWPSYDQQNNGYLMKPKKGWKSGLFEILKLKALKEGEKYPEIINAALRYQEPKKGKDQNQEQKQPEYCVVVRSRHLYRDKQLLPRSGSTKSWLRLTHNVQFLSTRTGLQYAVVIRDEGTTAQNANTERGVLPVTFYANRITVEGKDILGQEEQKPWNLHKMHVDEYTWYAFKLSLPGQGTETDSEEDE